MTHAERVYTEMGCRALDREYQEYLENIADNFTEKEGCENDEF